LHGREQGEQGELYRGFGDSLSRSFELALTPPIIGAFGYLLDRLLGIVPVLTIVFFLTAMIGLIATMWYGYDARMKIHEQAGPWAKQNQD
jgi:F0F1-type ATP synthase assembly protein I